MERIGDDIGQLRRYPVDFPLLEIGYNVAIKSTLDSKYEFYRILNRSRIPETVHTEARALVASGGRVQLGNMSEWLKTDDKRALYCLSVGARCDRDLDMIFNMPASDTLFGTKQQPTLAIKIFDTPVENPELWFWTKGDKWIPHLTIENNTEYDPLFFEIVARGYKYRIEQLTERPQRYHEICLQDVRGGL